MPNNGELMISNRDGVYRIKVNGRATFECAPPLRDLAKTLDTEPFSGIFVDLSACEWMDSTFMGVLAMLGLRARKSGVGMEIGAASDQNRNLLSGLGLTKLFEFTGNTLDDADGKWQSGSNDVVQADKGARTVLEAHQTLMGVDESNVEKFGKVVDLVQMDIDRMNAEKKEKD